MKDVLKVDDAGVAAIYRTGRLPGGVSEEQLLRLGGEAVLKKLGFSWNEEKRIWERTGTVGMNSGAVVEIDVEKDLGWKVGETMCALGVDERGIIQERFVVWERVERNVWSYLSDYGEERFLGLDTLYVIREDVEGRSREELVIDGVQTVDSMKSGTHNQPLDADHPLAVLGLQGNTIMEDAYLRLSDDGGGWETDTGGTCRYSGVIHDTVVLDGDEVFYSGLDDDRDRKRWLQHDYEGPDPRGHWASDGCITISRENREMIERMLYDVWGLKEGYEVWMDVQYPVDWYWQVWKYYSLYGPESPW